MLNKSNLFEYLIITIMGIIGLILVVPIIMFSLIFGLLLWIIIKLMK